MSRYFFFDAPRHPGRVRKDGCRRSSPTTAPGNFTRQDNGYWVMTTFYPYQWDLNYRNPRVFNEMMYNFLFLANKGRDIIRIDAVPLHLEGAGHQLPQPAQSPHHCADDAHDRRDCLSQRHSAG